MLLALGAPAADEQRAEGHAVHHPEDRVGHRADRGGARREVHQRELAEGLAVAQRGHAPPVHLDGAGPAVDDVEEVGRRVALRVGL